MITPCSANDPQTVLGIPKTSGDAVHTSNVSLKVLPAERDWTQAQLASQLALSRQTINAIKKGKFDPGLPLAFKAANLFESTIEEIFQYTENE